MECGQRRHWRHISREVQLSTIDLGRQAAYDCVDGLILLASRLEATSTVAIWRHSAPGAQGWVDEVGRLVEFALESFSRGLCSSQAPSCSLDSSLDFMGADRSPVSLESGLDLVGADRL